MVGSHDHTAALADRMAGDVCRTAASPRRAAGITGHAEKPLHRTEKSFHRAAESFYHTVFPLKYAKNVKNRTFNLQTTNTAYSTNLYG